MVMQGEELGYNSTEQADRFLMEETKPQDEMDMPALESVQAILNSQIASYSTVDRLTTDEKDLTVKQQLAVNKAVVFHLNEVKSVIDKTIDEIREKYKGQG